MPEAPSRPDAASPDVPAGFQPAALLRSDGPLRTLAFAATGLFVLALFYTLYVAAGFFLPVVIALLLNFLLAPLVRSLQRVRVPAPLGAALVLIGLVGAAVLGLYYLSGPAATWIEEAPETLRRAEYQLRGIQQSVEAATEQVQEITGGGADSAQQTVRVQRASAANVLLNQTGEFIAGTAIVLFLLYFLLASGDLFLRKLVHTLSLYRRKRIAVEIAHGIERDLSHYLLTYAIINTVLGTVVGLGFYFMGLPNPVLWGLMVAVLNFVPYLGPLVGVVIISLVALVSFESTAYALAVPAYYFAVNALEGNLITPMIMGQRLQLNPVAIFISLTFWGWLWGVAGALLAVPLLVMFKIICDNVATMAPVGEFLGQ